MTTQLCCAEKGNVYEIISVKGINRCRLAELGFNQGILVTVNSHAENSPVKVNRQSLLDKLNQVYKVTMEEWYTEWAELEKKR